MNRVRNMTQMREQHAPKSQRCVLGPELRVGQGAERQRDRKSGRDQIAEGWLAGLPSAACCWCYEICSRRRGGVQEGLKKA